MKSTSVQTPGAAVMEEQRLLSTIIESDGRPTELECDHFSIRGYVAQHQKKDPKLCSLGIFNNQQQYDEHNSNSSPLLVAKYQQWNCLNCLRRVRNSGHGTSSGTVPMQQDGTNNDCSISIIRTLPYSAGSRRLFSCTQQSSQGNDTDQLNVLKSVQESNLKYSSPSDNKAVTAVNVPATPTENNVPDTFVEISFPDTKGSPNNPHICVPDVDCNEPSVHEPISGHEGSKSISRHKSNQVRNQRPRRAAAPKRNVSNLKFYQRKPKKTRLISEIMNPQAESYAVDTEVDHAKTNDICENSTLKRSMLRTNDLGQVEVEGTVQRCATKVSLGKGKIQHNVCDLHKENITKNKKKHTLEVQTVIDDIPMDIVELLARKQHEKQLMTNIDSTQPKIAAVEIADKDGPTDASTVLDTNFQKSLASESKQKSLHGRASSSIETANVLLRDLHRQESSQCHAASSTYIPITKLHLPTILECTQEQEMDICRDEDVTIAYGASNDYATPQPVITAVEGQYTKEAVNQVQPTSAPSTALTMKTMPTTHLLGHSDLYPKEAMPATYLVGLMESSTSQGFTSYQNLYSQYAHHNQYNASPSTSHGSHPTGKVQLTPQDLGRHEVEKNLHIPLRPRPRVFFFLTIRPRVGVFGPLLQREIANWSESSGHSLGCVFSVVNPKLPFPRSELVRKDMCHTNRNPADFTMISDENEYMINH